MQRYCYIIFVFSENGIGFVLFSDLTIDVEDTNYIEEEFPVDAKNQIGTTWKYVNKDGSPDGRFSNNLPLPIAKYARLTIHGPGGFKRVWLVSDRDTAQCICKVIEKMKEIDLSWQVKYE